MRIQKISKFAVQTDCGKKLDYRRVKSLHFASAKQGEPLVDYVPRVALHLLSPDQVCF